MEKKEACPQTPVVIHDRRDIVNCDNLMFPWKQDENGYFLVKIERGMICCGFVNTNHEMIVEFRGTNPDTMVKEIVRRNLCDKEHVAYIAQELMIAYYCLRNNTHYVQR
jgi:hypothetical protein